MGGHTTEIFAIVVILTLVAIISMGCLDQPAQTGSQQAGQVIYNGSQDQQPADNSQGQQAIDGQAQESQAPQQPQYGNYSGQYNGTRGQFGMNSTMRQGMRQAEIAACAGKAENDSCTMSFGNAAAPAGAPGQQFTPSGTCQYVNGTVLSCRMQGPQGAYPGEASRTG